MQANWWSQPHQALTPQEECISRLICKYYVQGEFDPRKLEFKVDNNRLYFRYTKGRWIAWYSTNVIVSGGGGYFDIDKYAININDATGEATIVDRDVVTNPKESLHAVREITSPNVNMGYIDVTDLGQNVLSGNMNYIQYENGSSSSKNVTFGITKNALGEAVKNAVSIPADIKIEGDSIYLVDGNGGDIGNGASLDGISRVIDFNEKNTSFNWDETEKKWVADVKYNRTGNPDDKLQLNISLDDIVGGLSGQFATGVSSSADGGYQLISGSSPIGDPFYVHRVIDFNDDTFRFSRTGDNVQATISYSTDSNASDSYTLTIPVNAFSENLAKGLSTSKDSNNRTTSIGLVFMNDSTSWVSLDLGSLVGGSSNGKYINLLALGSDNKFYNADTETTAVVARKDASNNVIIGLETILGDGADINLRDKAYIKIPKAYLGATNGLAVGEKADGTPAIGMAGEDNTLDTTANTVPLSDIIAGITGGVRGNDEWWIGLTRTVGTSAQVFSSISFLELFGGGEGGGAGGANKFVKLEASDKAGNAYSDDDGYFRYVKASNELQTSLKVTVGGLSDTVNLHIESAELRSAVSQVLGGLSMVGNSIQLIDDQDNPFGKGVTFKDIVDPNGNTPDDKLLKIAIREYDTAAFIDDGNGWIYNDTTNKTIKGSGKVYYLGLKTELGQHSSEPTNFILNISGALSGEKTYGMTIINNGTLYRGGIQDEPPAVPLGQTRIITFADADGTGADTENTHQNNVAQVEIVNGISAHTSGSDTYLQLTYYEYNGNTTQTFGNSISLRSILNPGGGNNPPVNDPDVINLEIRNGTEYSKLGEFYELNSDYYGDFQITLGRYITSASIKLGSDILNNALQSIGISGDASQDTRKITLSPSASGSENSIKTSKIVKGLSVGRIDGSSETQLTLTYIGDDDKTYAFGGVNIQTLFSSYSSSSVIDSRIIDLQIKNLNDAYTNSGNFIYDSSARNLHGDFRVILGGSNGYYADATITLESSTLESAVFDVIGGLSISDNGSGVYNLYIKDTKGKRIGSSVSFSDLLRDSGKPNLDITSLTDESYAGATPINRNTLSDDFIYAFTMTPSVGGVTGNIASAYLNLTELVTDARQSLEWSDFTDSGNRALKLSNNASTVPVSSIVNGLSMYGNNKDRYISLTYDHAGGTSFGNAINIKELFGGSSGDTDLIKLGIANGTTTNYVQNGEFIKSVDDGDYYGYFKVSLGDYSSSAQILLRSVTIRSEARGVIGGLQFDNTTGNLYIKGSSNGDRIGESVDIGTLTSIDFNAAVQGYGNRDGILYANIPLSLTVHAHGKSATSNSSIDLNIIDVTKFNVSKNTAGSLVFKYDTIELSSPVDLTPALQDLTELTGLAIKGTDTTTNRITNMTKEFQTYVGGDYENSATIHEALGQLYLNNKDFPQVVAQHVPTPDTYENQLVNENTRVLMVHPPGITDISRTALDNEHITFVRGVPGNVGHQTYDANLYYFIS